MQTHSCKPHKAGEARDYSGYDTRFSYDASTGQIESYAYEGVCVQALLGNNVTVFALLECSDNPRQKFVYDNADQTLRLSEDKERCVSVVSETEAAGPWVKRTLSLENCEEVDTSVKQWSVVSE